MPGGKPSKGKCAYCGTEISKNGTTKHLSACPKRQMNIVTAEQKKGGSETLYHLRVQDAWRNEFWLDLEMRGSSTLKDLDFYLRGIWLECCGHLSRFSIGGKEDCILRVQRLCCRNGHGDELLVFLRCEAQEDQSTLSSPQLARV